MTAIKIAPSILAADFSRLGEEVARALEGGADWIHVDVMDGIFVPNLSLGFPVLRSLRKAFPTAFMDVHLMIDRPVRYVDEFCNAGADMLTLHVEADAPDSITAALDKTRRHGVKTGLSIKPATPAEALEPWAADIDMALVMTVEPGFGGQSFMTDLMPKLRRVREMMDKAGPGRDVEVDGGITRDTAVTAIGAGANVLVSGSAVFRSHDYAAAIKQIRGR